MKKAICLVLLFSLGCQKLDRLTGTELSKENSLNAPHIVSCCKDNNDGVMTYPSFLPASHVSLCQRATIQAGNIDGDVYIPMNVDCGHGYGHIGDEYYVGKGY